MASRGPTSENSDMENANKPASSSWPLKQGPKKWSKHGCDKGTLTVVRRPIKWAQSGRLLPLLWSDSSLRRDDHIKRDPDGPDRLKSVHCGGLYDTHLVSSCDFREAARSGSLHRYQDQCLGLSCQRTGLLEELYLVEFVAFQELLAWGRVLLPLEGFVGHFWSGQCRRRSHEGADIPGKLLRYPNRDASGYHLESIADVV